MTRDLVDRAAAVEQLAIDGNLFAGPHAKAIADHHLLERNVLVRAIGRDAARGFWREIEQSANRAAGLLSRAQLQHLAEQHENGDDGGGLEIDRDRAIRIAEGRGKQRRREGREHAIGPGDARAHGDEREHVEIARDERPRRPREERRAGPQHRRSRQSELNPIGGLRRNEMVKAEEMSAHLQNEDWNRESEADPEAPRHVDELRARSCLDAREDGLERHSADRTIAGLQLTNLRMHWAGVDHILLRAAPSAIPERGLRRSRRPLLMRVVMGMLVGHRRTLQKQRGWIAAGHRLKNQNTTLSATLTISDVVMGI